MYYRDWIKPGQSKVSDTFDDSHWDTFARARRKHNDNICEQTNKLVLRLDKLINPTTPDGKKVDLDKSLVEWTSDDLVKLCPYCAKAFNIARRRHHCRLCGAILCGNCSQFFEHRAACKLVKPSKLFVDPYDRIQDQLESKSAEEMPKIRACEDCKRLLDKRVQIIEDHYEQPTFLSAYERLRKSMAEADELMLLQSSIAPSGRRETTAELKAKIQEFRQNIAALSARIKKLSEREQSDKQAYLLAAISQSAVVWLKESLDSKINRIHGQARSRTGAGSSTSGWVPEQAAGATARSVADDEDPLLTQIKNLDEYIKQAKLACRYEEVGALEANKRDLEIEYFIQQDVSSLSMEERADSMNPFEGDADVNVNEDCEQVGGEAP